MARELIYVPVIHTQAEMGSMSEAAREEYFARFGREKWHQHVKIIDSMWDGLRRKILALKLAYRKVRIYQDGLPVCGKELEIVTELARKGSRNHALLLWLVGEGAMLVGTEAPGVLLEEHELVRSILATPEGEERRAALEAYKVRGKKLLARRDEYIGSRIDATLPADCTGLLFIGLMHRVDEVLPEDVSVSYLIHRLPFRRASDINHLGAEKISL